jgi:deoxyxylulose-5-phosphate synthase
MSGLRQAGGISVLQAWESEYDSFGAGHPVLLFQPRRVHVAAEHAPRKKNNCVAVIGDGAITGVWRTRP